MFNQIAKEDSFGRDIRLGNGNVASRILPVKIHELDAADTTMIESELGGPLRSIDFIFKSQGVNRPLRDHEDQSRGNLNKTLYRDQINKSANAIKELIQALKNPEIKPSKFVSETRGTKSSRKRTYVVASLIVLIVSVVYFLSAHFNSGVPVDNNERSIAVMPFVNMSTDPDQEYFSDGITEQIITNLARINSFKVIARTSVMKFKKSNKSIAEIGQALGVTHVLEGSIRKSDHRVRVTAQLISVTDESHIWAQDYDRELSDIFTVQDEVSVAIANSLQRKLTLVDHNQLKSERPSNVEAYQHYLKGYYQHVDVYYVKRLREDFIGAEKELKLAISLDPGYGLSYAGLADLYDTYRNSATATKERLKFEELRDSCSLIAIRLAPGNPYVLSVRALTFSNKANRTDADLDSAFIYKRRAYQISPNESIICDALSVSYAAAGLYE